MLSWKSSSSVVRQQQQRHSVLFSSSKYYTTVVLHIIIIMMMMLVTLRTRIHTTQFIPATVCSSVQAFQIVTLQSQRPSKPQQQHLPSHPSFQSLGGLRTTHSIVSSWLGGLKSTTATTTDPDVTTTTTTATTENESPLPPIDTMTGREMKLELERYGISTKAFFEKSEYRSALEKARADGLQPKPATTSTATTTSSSSSSSSTSTTDTVPQSSSLSRDERIRVEMTSCQNMAARDMKQELEQIHGVSTRSMFEKSEFLRALAEARVDGVTKKGGGSSSSSSTSNTNTSRNNSNNNEGYAEYKDVEVLTDDSSGPRQKGQDAKSTTQQQQVQQPMNPFAGMGGMDGGMGGFANLFKTMGGVGNASPFGSGGGNPFGNVGSNGNMMGKVQEMMSNPKVMAILQKAQSNPRMMAKVQECMTNPTAMLKYQNDPDVAELIRELQPYLK